LLAKRWLERGDRDAEHRLVTSHLRLVAKIATGYRGYGLPAAEIIAEGNLGLMKAVRRFDPEKASVSPLMPCGGSGHRFRNTCCARGRW
jgi:RNA polymerase sigma-32 factor